MSPGAELSILQRVSKADLVNDPYPHLILENALPEEIFARLELAFPEESVLLDGREARDTWFDYPACRVVADERIAPIWRDFFRYHTSKGFFDELVGLAGERLLHLRPDLERRVGRPLKDFKVGMRPGGRGDPLAEGADVSTECQFYLNYTRKPRTVRGPHVDRPSELFAALLYFRHRDDPSSGADLEVCEAVKDLYPDEHSVRISHLPAEIDDADVKVVKTARYAPNTLVLFLNSARSIHAVSPRTPTEVPRRHINFCCDLRFDLFEMKLPPRLAAKKLLADMPLAWRLARYL